MIIDQSLHLPWLKKKWPEAYETLPRNMNPLVMHAPVEEPVRTGIESYYESAMDGEAEFVAANGGEQRTLDDFDPATLGEQPPY